MIFRGLAFAAATLLASTALGSRSASAQEGGARAAFAEPSLSPDGSLIAFASGGDIRREFIDENALSVANLDI